MDANGRASLCAGCRAPRGPNAARCSRCKWVWYCSKACQRVHWTRRHRSMCASLQVAGAFRALEQKWWRTRPLREMHAFVTQSGLQPESMRFFGEVLFLLSGLKPMVMLSNLPAPWRSSFITDVIAPSGVLSHADQAQCTPALYVISGRVETPAEYDMSGDLMLVNTNREELLALAVANLRLRPLHDALSSASAEVSLYGGGHAHDKPAHVVREEDVARLLDYPVALSECKGDSMVEVGYFLDEGDCSGSSVKPQDRLLTSYCASEKHAPRVRAHFERYTSYFQASGAIHLKCAMTSL
uniref:MYND-type domain-containing protein n=1 Tax=Globisporangium ultimum (strain ATCC 200006 / CBS 805.95 / DAOM BR144) TaxID=431595 RepID=K3WWU4_GLOUD